MTISIATGMASGGLRARQVRRAGKKPKSTTSATPTRKMKARGLRPGLERRPRGGAPRRRDGAGLQARLVLGVVLQVLAHEHRDDRRREHADQVDGTQIIRICGSPHWVRPFSANSPIIAAVAAATGLAVIACCEAMVATAIGRSGRMPFWCAIS